MRKTIAGLLALVMMLTLGVGTVTATGNSNTSLNACTNETDGYYGGVKVYARDKARGASRVMCPPTELAAPTTTTEREGSVFDRNLNRRNKNRPPLQDVWNGFHKNIESFKLRAAPGCAAFAYLGKTDSKALFRRILDNTEGTVGKTRRYEVPARKDNKATKVLVGVYCPEVDVTA